MVAPPDNDTGADADDRRRLHGRYADEAEAIDRAPETFAFLRGVPILFEIDDATLWNIARGADVHVFEPGERVVAEGEDDGSKRFFVIRSGSADVIRRDRSGADRVVARLSVGSYFGELGLLTNQARNASIRVHGAAPLRVYAFDALTFHSQIARHVLVFRVLSERQDAQSSSGRGRLRLKELGLLDRMPDTDLRFVLERAEHRWYPAGTPIVSQGMDGDRFFIILKGTVAVERDGEHVADLGPGDFFGETALLLDMPRTATVRSTAHSLVWSITRPAFQRLVGNHLLANGETKRTILARIDPSHRITLDPPLP